MRTGPISRKDPAWLTYSLLLSAAVHLSAAAPFPAAAQPVEKVYRIGFISAGVATAFKHRMDAFRNGLRSLGYVDGKNVVIVERYGEGRSDLVPKLAAALVRLRPDVIVTHGGAPAIAADREAKRTGRPIPIVFAVDANPVARGAVASLAKPGGNITGLTDSHADLVAKRLEVFEEIVPSIRRVAVLMNPDRRTHVLQLKALRSAAHALGLTILPVSFQKPSDFDRVVADIERKRADALMHLGYALMASHRKKFADLGIEDQLPTLGTISPSAEAGFLASYGTSLRAMYRRAATYVDKILKGAKPADLPVEQPTRFYLTVNAKTAKAIGITIPRAVLLRADEVIE